MDITFTFKNVERFGMEVKMAEQLAEQFVKAVLVIFLGIQGITDYRRKSVSLLAVLAAMILFIAVNLHYLDKSIPQLLLGFVPALLLLAISAAAKRAVGSGDAAVLAVIGSAQGLYASIAALAYAATAAAVISCILLLSGKVKLHSTIPFVPFMLVGYVEVILFG